MSPVFAHVFGVPVEETLLAVMPAGLAAVVAARATRRRLRRPGRGTFHVRRRAGVPPPADAGDPPA